MSHNFKTYFDETLRRILPIQSGEKFAVARISMTLRKAKQSNVWRYSNGGSEPVTEFDSSMNFANPAKISFDDWSDEMDRLSRHEEVFALKWACDPHFLYLQGDVGPYLEDADLLGVDIHYRRDPSDPLEYTMLVLAFFEDRKQAMLQRFSDHAPIVTASHLPLRDKGCCDWVQEP